MRGAGWGVQYGKCSVEGTGCEVQDRGALDGRRRMEGAESKVHDGKYRTEGAE